jgi:hypothetical protein
MRSRIPSPSLAIAVLALVVAVGGGSAAIALRGKGRVTTDDIRRAAVKTKKLGNFAVTPPKTNLGRFGFSGGEVTTTAGPAQTLAGGPFVRVFVPKGALVAVHAEVEMRSSAGAQRAQVHLVGPGTLAGSPRIIDHIGTDFDVRRTAPGSEPDNRFGVSQAVRAGQLVFSLPPGKHTFGLRYSSTGGATAVFRDRKLWVTVLS